MGNIYQLVTRGALISKGAYGSKNLKPLVTTLICFFLTISVYAQNSVSGVVRDEKNQPLTGATVVVQGTQTGTTTDSQGKFTLKVSGSVNLSVSYIGYKQQTVKATAGGKVTISLEADSETIEDVQIIAYGQQKKVTVTGSVSSVSGSDLMRTPVASLGNALTGNLTGVSTVQYSGQPGADDPTIFVRGIGTLSEAGAAPLTLVDGVERGFFQIDPNEIADITVLKDASATAVFGVRGANGVILVTTKRGTDGKAKVSVSSSVGVQVPTRLLELANSYEYASFKNAAFENDGSDPFSAFSEEAVTAFKNHTDPLLYPDVNWLDYCLKKASTQSQHNINVSGGTKNVRYFASIGAFTQGGLFKTFDKGDDFNFNYNRYNYRANLDVNVTKTTLMAINLGGRVDDRNQPIGTEDGRQLFREMYWATPFSGPGVVDGKWIKSNPDYVPDAGKDALNAYYGRGYESRVTNTLNVDISVSQKLDIITKGLSIDVKGAYNTNSFLQKNRTSSLPTYVPDRAEDGSIFLMRSGDESELAYGESNGKGRNWYAEARVNYKRSFGSHNVGALVLYNQSKTYYPKTFADIPSGYVGLVGRVTYDFRNKYMIDFNMGYNGSENFIKDKRYGFFPAISAGWVVTGENFLKDSNWLSYMKLRASYGVVGNDKIYIGDDIQRFLYTPDLYNLGGAGYNFGTNVSSSKPGAYEGRVGNPNVTWEKAFKQNYGVDINLFNNRIKINFDYFEDRREDILITRKTTPGFVAITLPAINMGVVENKGYEIAVGWNDKIGDKFKYWVNFNLTHSRNKIIENDEVEPNEEYMRRTGNPVGQPFVRKFWGFYDETANERYKAQYGQDIAEHAGGLLPGDCVYVDLNKDGTIDTDDIMALGYTNNPEYAGGTAVGFRVHGFEFNMMWTYAWNVSRLLSETLRDPMGDTQNKGLLRSHWTDRWTPETASKAKYPRPTIAHKPNNIKENSDLWLKDASYLRLKSVELGYNFGVTKLQNVGISELKVFVNGYNLLTFDRLKITDPESRTSDRPAYPLTRVFNLGLKVTF